MMKNTIKLFDFSTVLSVLLFICITVACSDNEDGQVTPDVKIVAGTFNIPAVGEGETLLLQADAPVTVTSNASWCKVTEKKENGVSYYATIEVNTATEPREAVIAINSDNIAKGRIVVKQEAAAEPEVPEIPEGSMESDAMTLAAKMYAGWNIGNTLEAVNTDTQTAGETLWGNPAVTEALIKKVKEHGFNAVRIPCAWDYHITNKDTYEIDPAWLNRVYEVVGYCVSNDVYAIVNIHWDGGWLENNCTADKQEANNKKQKALWTQIASKLNSYDEHVLFAGCNEPNVEDAGQMAVLKSYEQTFIDAVRATGGNNAVRNLIVQGPATDIGKTSELFGEMPADVVKNRLMVEVHYYNPWTFCGLEEDASWGKMAYFWGDYKVDGSDRNATSGDVAEMKGLFAKMKSQFVDKGIPVILGEYGAVVRTGLGSNQEAHDKSRGQFDEVVTREAKNYGMVPFYWDGGTFAMIKRADGTIGDQYAYDGIMKGAGEGKYPY